MINIYNIEQENYVNGTGCRYVLWVQGCSLGCKECWNKDSWNNKLNILKSVDEIFNEIQKLQNDIDGVTFTGGEPFEQVEQLSILAKMIKSINLNLHILLHQLSQVLMMKSGIMQIKTAMVLHIKMQVI